MEKKSPAVRVLRHGSFSSKHSAPAKNGDEYLTSGAMPAKFDHSIPTSNHENTVSRKHDTYDPFSDYIRRAKLTIRTLTFAGGGRNAAGVAAAAAASSVEDDAEKHRKKNENNKDNNFSDFIRRARMRIRTSSNLGRGKSTSFKRE